MVAGTTTEAGPGILRAGAALASGAEGAGTGDAAEGSAAAVEAAEEGEEAAESHDRTASPSALVQVVFLSRCQGRCCTCAAVHQLPSCPCAAVLHSLVCRETLWCASRLNTPTHAVIQLALYQQPDQAHSQ